MFRKTILILLCSISTTSFALSEKEEGCYAYALDELMKVKDVNGMTDHQRNEAFYFFFDKCMKGA